MFISVCLLAGATSCILLRRHEAVDDEKSDRIASTAQMSEGSKEVRQYCRPTGKRDGLLNALLSDYSPAS
jgi:hypothetical protein